MASFDTSRLVTILAVFSWVLCAPSCSKDPSSSSNGESQEAPPSTPESKADLTDPPSPPSPALPEDMVWVPAGEFWAGRPENLEGFDHVKPLHKVYLDGFAIDRFEVSRGEFVKCIEQGRCQDLGYSACMDAFAKENESTRVQDALDDDLPAQVCVTLKRAVSYCATQGKRLPTPLEWEKAARGTDARFYPWGFDEPSCHVASIKRYKSWSPLGCSSKGPYSSRSTSLPPSPVGAYHMVGSAREWTLNDTVSVERGGSYESMNTDWFAFDTRFSSEADKELEKNSHVLGGGIRCAKSIPGYQSDFELPPAPDKPWIPYYMPAEGAPIERSEPPKPVADALSLHDEMVWIPAGPFLMGCPAGVPTCANLNRHHYNPLHTVTLGDYLIDRFEVSNRDYNACVERGQCSERSKRLCRVTFVTPDDLWEQGFGHMKQPSLPAFCVTADQAQQYCESLGKTLPTEEQWEKAARGTDARLYPWGDDPAYGARGNIMPYDRIPRGERIRWGFVPVDTANGDVSPYGVQQMAGNVSEWTLESPYYHTLDDLLEALEIKALKPQGPRLPPLTPHVARGGYARLGPDMAFTFRREAWHTWHRPYWPARKREGPLVEPRFGFRCALTVSGPTHSTLDVEVPPKPEKRSFEPNPDLDCDSEEPCYGDTP